MVAAEKAVREVEGLPLVVLRLGSIYGRGVMGSIDYALANVRVACEDPNRAFYNIFLENGKLNVVHAEDAARAILHAASWYLQGRRQGTRVFNVADKSDYGLAEYHKIVCDLQQVEFPSPPRVFRALARFALKIRWLCELMITQGSKVWIGLLNEHGIVSTPLNYSIDFEMSSTPWGISLDGSAFCEETGFTYQYPTLTQETLLQCLNYWRDLGAWPDEENCPGRKY
ncbi:hypothetical protein BJ684DRAFT_20809 [Piptocephalis cylindrospora]|uniref:NAD-dependent epimerase/dehydratase domain-containing protein n=1 Tax=Piptocephalis cylindrospora TaxID=1907219 RepID=A0A4P9Y1I4_9FUNG|nr:hypothetical protein BJ684DRAFT_20809 [Piptocephalis cylindrospora]|eukprot:RKP12668.1 hypothetical protein BJ684DRAFT_20809 [Piptocephalis cylindrospora]